MFKALAVAGAAMVSLVSIPAVAGADEIPPGKVTVDVATINGSGCKKDTAAVVVSDDNTSFTVSYSDFVAEAGPDSPATAGRKNCQLALRVHVPQGFTYAITQADFRGYANLLEGAKGLHRTNYYIQGSPNNSHADERFEGPYDDNWIVTDRHAHADLVWSPCGETKLFNVNTELRVNTADSSGTSFMTMDSTDGSSRTQFQWAWKRC